MIKRWTLNKAIVCSLLVVVLTVATILVRNGLPKPHDRDALWKIIQQCTINEQQEHDPHPCKEVNLEKNYAILKDRVGIAQYLLIPTKKITGIEDPDLLAPNGPNYWQAAWDARHYLFEKLGHDLPVDAIGMAINSPMSRSQDQLHIHIDCVKAEVSNLLLQHAGEINEHWHVLSFPLAKHIYHARRIHDLETVEPFHLFAQDNDLGDEGIGRATLIVLGSKGGFMILYDIANPTKGNVAHGEDLLDHSCNMGQAIKKIKP